MFLVRRDVRALNASEGAASSSGEPLRFELQRHDDDDAPMPAHRRASRRGLPLASLSSAFVRTMGAEKTRDKFVREPRTSIEYPEEYCTRGAFRCTELTGLGVRSKNLLGLKSINVYTVGVYVDHGSARSALSKYAGRPAEQLVKEQGMYNELVAHDGVEKTLRLVISYGGLKRDTFINALDERMAGPMKKAGEEAMLAAFRAQFEGAKLHKGTEFTFTNKHGKLTSRMDGRELGTLASKNLVHALFDIYVGPDPVSPAAKESLGRGLAAVLNKTA